jgi:hypothetical protein
VPEHPDAPALLRAVKQFVLEHDDCSFAVTLGLDVPLPRPRQPAVIDLTDGVREVRR